MLEPSIELDLRDHTGVQQCDEAETRVISALGHMGEVGLERSITIQLTTDGKGASVKLVFSINLSIYFLPAHVGNLNLLCVSENIRRESPLSRNFLYPIP